MVFTLEKLQRRVRELNRAASSAATMLTPVRVVQATGSMTLPPESSDAGWQNVELGQTWGQTHGTNWLLAELRVPEAMIGKPVVLELHWGPGEFDFRQWVHDALLIVLEATVFLDGKAIGAFDWRHPTLLLPAAAIDGQKHVVTIQVYTRQPLPFGGLSIRTRNEMLWHFATMMQTALESLEALDENSIARHTLLERLNTAYTMLDLRQGWQGELLEKSAAAAWEYLRTHLTEHLAKGNRPQIIASGHAHLDLAWQWPYWRTHQKIAHTVANVLDLMDRYPFYHYSQSQPQALQWLKEDVPELYARVKERVAEGRFEPVGAMWVEADCNLTSGESLVRQIMHGLRFTEQEFGYRPRHVWLPDVFGYSAALPQIMRGCDLPVFMTTKISWNQFNRMPCDTFRWRGIDGSEVLTHFVTAPDEGSKSTYYTYNGPMRPADMVGTWQNYRQQAINDQLLYMAGWGDGGGGPTEDMLERIPTMADLPEFPQVKMGRVEEYFTSLYDRVWENPALPTWVGELYLEYHRGTYTSQARTKQNNRRSELFYREVEFLNSWASLYGMPSRQQELNEGWRHLLLNQFHDVLPGSSIHEVYDDATRLYVEIGALGEKVRAESLAFLSKQFGWQENDLVAVNTLPWERTDPAQLPVEAAQSLGNHYQTQKVQDWDGHTFVLVDGLPIPACGATVLTGTVDHGAELSGTCGVEREENGALVLRNAYYDLTINQHGEMSRLYDKQAERDVFVPGQVGNQIVAFEDKPLNFDAWDIDLFYEEKPYPIQASSVKVIEEGPVRVTVEVKRSYMTSRITQRISLWRTSPRIDVATEIEWHEHQTVLKAAFPVDINSAQATYEIQFGSVQRPTHRNTSWDLARFEVCAHRWVDLGENGYGVSLLNDSKYGHDIHDNVLRLTLLKSGISPDPDADQGLHRFTYSLLPHQGDWRDAEVVRRAYELNVPIVCVPGQTRNAAEHTRGTEQSFLRSDCEHVVVETVKPAEDGDGLIVRLYEAHNRRGRGAITFAAPIVAAEECNLLEEPKEAAAYQGNTLSFQVRPFEIKTFRVRLTSV